LSEREHQNKREKFESECFSVAKPKSRTHKIKTLLTLTIQLCLQKNIGLRKLDIAWNGFAKNDAVVLGKSIKENTTLKELDISHNRLEKEGFGFLLQGIKDSDGLEILRVSPHQSDVRSNMEILF
jgi:Ran GTPase-activating protein (RanGAP) involved in mRNA processing and transport